jgi:hypothetical protein
LLERQKTPELIGSGLMACAIFVAPLMLGTVHRQTTGILLAMMTLSACLFLYSNRRSRFPTRLPASFVALGILALWSTLQTIPIPAMVLSLISPHASDIWRASLEIIGLQPGWHAISMQPSASSQAALRFATLAMAVLAIANYRDRTNAWRIVVVATVAGTCASWGIGLGHHIAGVAKFYGLFEASLAPKMSTFVSSNHAASLIGLASLVVLGFAWRCVHDDQATTAGGLALLGMVLFVGMMESDSAGVLLMFFIAVIIFITRQLIRKVPERRPAVIALAGAAGVGSGLAMFYEPIRFWVLGSLETRFELIQAVLTGSTHAWLVGFGAGATETMLPPYVNWNLIQDARLITIESEPLEWLFTHGWPVTVLVIVLLGSYLLPFYQPADKQWSERKYFFSDLTWVISIYFAGIALLHFPFLALGVSLPALMLIESFQRQVFHRSDQEPSRPKLRLYPYLNVGKKASIGIALVTIGLGLMAYARSSESTFDVREQIPETPGAAFLFSALAREEITKGNPVQAEIFAARAVELEPNARMHLLHALTLAANKRGEEAVADYLVVGQSHLAARGAREAAAVLPPRLAAKAIPKDVYWREARQAAIKARGKNAGIDFVLALVDEHPKSSMAAQVAIEAYWQRKEYDVAELWARMLMADGRTDSDGNPIGPGLLIQTLLKANRVTDARLEATRAMEFVPGDPVVERAVIQLRPAKPADAQKADIEVVAKAHGLYCHSAHSGQERKFCELANAWLAEAAGDLKKAEEVLKGLTERFDSATPLAEFYVRTNQCASLRTLNMSWRDKPDSEKVATMAARCGVL